MSDLDQLLEQLADPSGLAWSEETYDLALARGLGDADRTTYVARLIDQAKQGDTRAILTLGHLHAVEALLVLQDDAVGAAPWAPTARRALVLLGRGGDVLDRIALDAVCASDKMTRLAAMMDLPKLGGPKAIRALEQALADDDSGIRMLAWNGLVATLDLDRWLRGPSGQHEKTTHLELIKDLLACDLPSLVKVGVDDMRAIIGKLTAGADPASIGLTWIGDPAPEVTRQIMEAIVDPGATYPIAGIATLTGVARRWAEASLAIRLDQPEPDPRVPDALVRLNAEWAVPVLDEVARSSSIDDALRIRLTSAAAALRAAARSLS